MFRSFLGRCALFLITLVALAPSFSIHAMDAPVDESSSWVAKSVVAMVTPMAAYGWLFRKHYNELATIEKRIDRSTVSATAKDCSFLTATWRSHPENTSNLLPWIYPSDIWQARNQVTQVLLDDTINFEDRTYFCDAFGTRHEPASLREHKDGKTRTIISQSIAYEKRWFEDQMAYVAQFTDVPQMIVKHYAPNDARRLEAFELAFGYALQLKDVDTKTFITFVETMQAQVDSASQLKSLVHCAGWLPNSWAFAPCYKDASRVYLKLFTTYARLCAIDAAWLQK